MKKSCTDSCNLKLKLKRHVETCRFMCPLYTLDITFRILKKTAMPQIFGTFRSQVSIKFTD